MQKNVGGYDRLARLVFGPLLVVVGLAGYVGLVTLAFGPFPQALTSVAVLLVGLVLAITGVLQRCPINSLLGVNTFRPRTEPEAAETETMAGEETRPGRSDRTTDLHSTNLDFHSTNLDFCARREPIPFRSDEPVPKVLSVEAL